ncbi:MAG: DNA-entry nuclease, partial [Loigolactobacillus coryniformis]|nr:DNA-entry nuclease [Loigolactobacillus coryniformis]
ISAAAQATSSAASTATSSSDATTTAAAPTTSSSATTGQISTDEQGQIVGNVNSKIYHTPDQAGYNMNAANAVHFNTEAEAQAAGYRKSLR